MKKNGFTIIELLAVISILVLGTLIIVPSVFSSLDRAKLKDYDRIVSIIEEGAESYYLSNQNQFTTLSSTNPLYISLHALAKESYIKQPLENPRSQEEFDYNTLVKVYLTNDGFTKFEFTNAYFRGNSIENLSIGNSILIDNTDIATDGIVTEVKVNDTTVALPYTLASTSSTTYTVTYTVSSNQKTSTLVRKIIFS